MAGISLDLQLHHSRIQAGLGSEEQRKILNLQFWCARYHHISGVVYLYILQLKKQSTNKALQNSKENRAQKARILKEKQFLKTVIIISCIAFVCVVPSMVTFQINHSLSLTTDFGSQNSFVHILHKLCRESDNLCDTFAKLSQNILFPVLQKVGSVSSR